MKLEIYEDVVGEWRWRAKSGAQVIFASADGYEKPQKLVQTLRKHVVRDDPVLEEELRRALKKAGRTETGAELKEPNNKKKAPDPVQKLSPQAAWPYGKAEWPFPSDTNQKP